MPEVLSLWEEMKKEIWAVLKNEPLMLCGDGRSDSLGFPAKYGTLCTNGAVFGGHR